VISDHVVRQALGALYTDACACYEFCPEGGAGAGKDVCGCHCHVGQPLSAAQRSAAAKRLAPAQDPARLRALQILLLVGSPAERTTVEARA
jgi:hypothetical protein